MRELLSNKQLDNGLYIIDNFLKVEPLFYHLTILNLYWLLNKAKENFNNCLIIYNNKRYFLNNEMVNKTIDYLEGINKHTFYKLDIIDILPILKPFNMSNW